MGERKTRELKIRRQKAAQRQRDAQQAEEERVQREAQAAANWMRFVHLRFPT